MTARTQAVAQSDLRNHAAARRMRPIDALTTEQRRALIWGEDYDAGARYRRRRGFNLAHTVTPTVTPRGFGAESGELSP